MIYRKVDSLYRNSIYQFIENQFVYGKREKSNDEAHGKNNSLKKPLSPRSQSQVRILSQI